MKKVEIIPNVFSDHNGIKLEINCKKKAGKITYIWRLKKMILNNKWVIKEIKGEIQNYLKTNENENMTHQNLWDAAKLVLRGKFITIQTYLKKQEKPQTI